MEHTTQTPEVYDFRQYDRLWQRVAPDLEPYPDMAIRSETSPPTAAPTPSSPAIAPTPESPAVPVSANNSLSLRQESQLPGAERNPCCMGTEAAEMLEVLTGYMEAALSDRRYFLALVRQDHYTLSDLLSRPGEAHLLLLETIQDPGNLGTILRAGEGAGITGIVMDRATVDIYNPKVIRSTMGSIFRVPFVYVEDLKDACAQLKAAGIPVLAAHLRGELPYDRADLAGPFAFLIGNEARGLREETAALADILVRIPMEGQVESLNAAVAASILMFEAARQRRSIRKK